MGKQLVLYLSVPKHDDSDAARAYVITTEDAWRAKGWTVFRPTRAETMTSHRLVHVNFDDEMAQDITLLLKAHAVALMPGWQTDRATLIEEAVARMFDKRIYDAAHPIDHPVTDHPYATGWDGTHQYQCCGKPDYCHLDGWVTFGRANR